MSETVLVGRERYPRFNDGRFVKALQTAVGFWQEKLYLRDWLINPPRANSEVDGFATGHTAAYRTGNFEYEPPDGNGWKSVDDRWCAQAVCHECLHLLLAPMGDVLQLNLKGRWLQETDDAEEGCVDRLATLIWWLLPEDDRTNLIRLFADAREKPHKKKEVSA
jgi:hypothetical protein